MDVNVYNSAIKCGNLEILKYLHENGCPCDRNVYALAVEHDHLEILKYLLSNRAIWRS